MSQLYSNWIIYSRLFPVEDDSASFFAALLPPDGCVLDAGCGSGELAERLRTATRDVVGLDLAFPAASLARRAARGDLRALPFAADSFEAIVSRLFGLAYASGCDKASAEVIANEVGRVSTERAVMAIEVPLAWRPHRLQGLEEVAQIDAGAHYRFRYLDELFRSQFGSAIQTSIEFIAEGNEYRVDAPLMVFHPEGMQKWLSLAGFGEPNYFAPYDLETSSNQPPDDCLRAVVQAARLGGGGAAAPSTVAKG